MEHIVVLAVLPSDLVLHPLRENERTNDLLSNIPDEKTTTKTRYGIDIHKKQKQNVWKEDKNMSQRERFFVRHRHDLTSGTWSGEKMFKFGCIYNTYRE